VSDTAPTPIDPNGSTAVVTGGASGIGRAIASELLARGARVVVADVEAPALDRTVGELSELADGTDRVIGVRTDVTDEADVAALADRTWDWGGGCDLLFLNAGVTSGGGGLPWQQEPNDWRWCFGVNVFGVGIGVSEFVPRMLESDTPSQVVVTSSKDGGIAPVATASVYAASKAAASCFTEALQLNLERSDSSVRASVFYPSGGLMETGLYSAARNRPDHLQRRGEGTGRTGTTFDELVDRVTRATGRAPRIADLAELARMAVDGACERRFVIAADLDATAELLHERADVIGRGEVPPAHPIGL
jgi:NAD(P)-dependent dehydrogenase (short-subunit alcohol dehydrogenase family)